MRPKSIRHLIVLCAVALAPTAVSAHEWMFRQYDEPESLADNRINGVIEDKDGSIWVATWGTGVVGISRVTVRTYTEAQGMPGDWVYCVAAAADGAIWAGSADGLARIHQGAVTAYTQTNTPQLPENEIWCLLALPKGRMCAGVGHGYVLLFDPAQPATAWQHWLSPALLGTNEVHDLLQARDGTIWAAAQKGGLWKYDGMAWERVNEAGAPVSANGLFEDMDGTLYAWDGALISRRDANGWTDLPALSGAVHGIVQSADGRLFAGGERGLLAQGSGGGWTPVDLGYALGTPFIRSVLIDRNNGIWLACSEGLVQGVAPAWQQFTSTRDGIALCSSALYGSPDTPPYVADVSGRILQFDQGHWRVVTEFPGRVFARLLLSPAEPESMWGMTSGTVLKFNLNTGQLETEVPYAPSIEANDIFLRQNGQTNLVSLTGLYALENGGLRLLPENDAYPGKRITGVAEASDGSVYVCYEQGAERWSDGHVERLEDRFPELDRVHFMDVSVAPDGAVWFATSGEGAYVLRGDSLHHLEREDGLRSNRIARVYHSKDGTVWFSSRRRGLTSLRDGRWVHYTTLQGLPNNNAEMFCEYPEGALWLSTANEGIYRYQADSEPPTTMIVSAPTEFGHKQNGLVLFSGRDVWNSTMPEDLVYSWRFLPIGGQEAGAGWTPFSKQKVAFINGESPGQYLFQVRAADLARNVDPFPASTDIRLTPPIWRTPAFFVPTTLLSLIALMAIGAWLNVQRAERRAKRELEASAASLENAQRIAHLGNWEWELNTGRLRWSAEICRIFGLDSATTEPTPAGFLQAVHPEDREMVDQYFSRAAEEGVPPAFEHRILRPNGEVRHVREQAEVGINSQGKVVRIFGTVADITQVKLNQQERERLIEDLKKALADVKTLSGLVPICAHCKNIRDDQGYWRQIEIYVREHSHAEFSHSICPTCAKELYGEHLLKEREGGSGE